MKVFSTIVRYILILFLIIAILELAFISIASSTILDKDYVLAKLEETNYYTGLYEKTKSNFEKYIQQSGLEEDVLDGILTEEKLKSDANIMISNIYDGTGKQIDVEEIKANLNNKIAQSVENPNLLEEQRESIDTFVNLICNEYTNTLVHTEYEQDINNVVMKMLKYSQLAKQASLIAILVIVIIILAISYKRVFRALASIGVALISSGLLQLAIILFINKKINVNTITIFNDVFSTSLRAILNDIVSKITIYGGVLLVAGILIVIIGNLIDSIKYKEED